MVYKQVNRWTKVCYTWVFTEIFVLYTSKIDMYIKELDMYKEIIMYIKEFWDLHRKGGPWSVKKFEEKRIRFYRSNWVDHGKRCKFVEKFWKDLESVFEIYLWEVWKRIGLRKFKKNHLWKCFEKYSKVSFLAR